MDWHIVLSVLAALAIWQFLGVLASVLGRRSRFLTRLVAISQVKDAEYRAKVRKEGLESPAAMRWRF